MSLEDLENNLRNHLIELFKSAYQAGLYDNKYPSVIDRHQAMEILKVGSVKFSEIINREDFKFVKVRYTRGKYSYVNLLKWINNE
ncbi:hypothetical protein [Mammaliicoccus sp. G-M28]|uniref:hypothetical protein n=1 Tax=Mammaliicoccus sp. G-M28 TaxID=2898688 RepID=UPI001EFB8996|nr:hypothetical protein [Mammaliicoccus sp. G-M28]